MRFIIILVWAYQHANFGPVIRSALWENGGNSESIDKACDHVSHYPYPGAVYIYPMNFVGNVRAKAEEEFAGWYKKRFGVAWDKNPNLVSGPWG